MDRPKFKLDKRSWRENKKLKRFPELKGPWLDVLLELDDCEEQGIFRGPLKQLANAAGVLMPTMHRLVKEQILKGAAESMTCEPYIHTNRDGEEIPLVEAQRGPIWFSSRIVFDAYLLRLAQKSGKKGGRTRIPALQGTTKSDPDHSTLGNSLEGASKGAHARGRGAGENAVCSLEVDENTLKGARFGRKAGVPPPSSSPPHTPPLTPSSTSPDSDAAHPATTRRKKRGEAVLSDEQNRIRFAFSEWYIRDGYPSTHLGVAYGFKGGRDAKAVLEILRHPDIAWDLEIAKGAAIAFFNCGDAWLQNKGHKLYDLAERIEQFIGIFKTGNRGRINGSHKRTAADRGEYQSDVRVAVQSLDD